MALTQANDNLLLGGTQDNGTVRYIGTSEWSQLENGDGGACVIDANDSHTLYSTYIRMTPVFKWYDDNYLGDITGGGGNWSGDPADWANGPLTQDPNNSNTLWVGTNRVWRTANGGTSWSALSGDITGAPGAVLRGIGLGLGYPHAVYASSSAGVVSFRSDSSSTWYARDAGLPPRRLPDVIVSTADWRNVYVCADTAVGGRVFSTTTAGASWTNVTGDLPAGLRALALAADFRAAPPALYLGTDAGVYQSTDGGAHWANTALVPVAVYDLGVDIAHNWLLAATHGRGMWRAHLPINSDVGPGEQTVPAIMAGAGVRPAAVGGRGEVVVRYQIPSSAEILLEMLDVRGRHVRWLDRAWREAGVHSVRWNGRDDAGAGVASGVYVCRLQAEGRASSGRVILLR